MYSIQNLIQLDNYNGVPLAGGKVYVYHQGRTELATIYSDYNGATPIANPATLDALGMQEIYVSQRFNYTVVVTDPYGNELFSRDIHTPINSISGSGLPYEGIYPINVDNTAYSISADTIPFGIQEPLYFVKDDAEGMIIGMSGEYIPQSGEYIPQSASGQFVPTSMMDLYASKAWVNNQRFITGIPESATWDTVTGKVDTTAFDNYSADISGQIDYVSANAGTTYSAGANIDITNDVISGKDWTDSITGASAYAYNEATAQIPTALTGDYIETSAMKSAQLGTSAFITGFYDGQISAAFANEANKAISANHADSAAEAGSAHSASYVFSGWGDNPTLYHTDSAIKQYYAVTGNIQGFPAGTLYKFNAYSADSATSALEAESANAVKNNGKFGTNITQSGGKGTAFFYMPAATPFGVPIGIYSPLQYATGACLAMMNGYFGAYYKANEWYVSNSGIGQALRGEVHKSRGVHISGANTAGYGFNLSINNISGINAAGSWKYGPAEDVALRAVSSCDMHESAFGYDASNNITAYNGSAFKAGGEFPQSATEAIEVVTGGSANWNSTTATVATNSGAWGGQGIEISAGFGIDIQLVDNKLLISLATATGDI